MINYILDSLKEELGSKLTSLGLPEAKIKGSFKLVKQVVSSKIEGYMSQGKIEDLAKLFSGTPPLDQSALVKSMISEYGILLNAKLGVDNLPAGAVSNFMIPFLMSRLSNAVMIKGGDEEAIHEVFKRKGAFNKMISVGDNLLKAVLSF